MKRLLNDEERTKSESRGSALVMASIPEMPIHWLWPGRIVMENLTLLVGEPNVGKSLVALDLAARVTRGAAWPDGIRGCAAKSVLVVSAEDHAFFTVRPALRAAGADMNKIATVYDVRDPGGRFRRPLKLPEDFHTLRDMIKERIDCRLVVIDPITAFVRGGINQRNTLMQLVMLANDLHVAILGVAHLRAGGMRAMYRTQGGLALTSTARAVWMAVDDREPVVGGQKSEVRGQKSGTRGLESGIRGLESGFGEFGGFDGFGKFTAGRLTTSEVTRGEYIPGFGVLREELPVAGCQLSEEMGEGPEVEGENAEVGDQRSEVEGQISEINGQESGDRSQNGEGENCQGKVAPVYGKRRLILPVKNNLVQESTGLAYWLIEADRQGTPRTEWEQAAIGETADEVLARQSKPKGPEATERKEAMEYLQEALANGPRLVKEVEAEAEALHAIKHRSLVRARKALGARAFRSPPEGPWWLEMNAKENEDEERKLPGTLGTLLPLHGLIEG